jgi:hypothetical protein
MAHRDGMTLFPPLLRTPVSGMDFKSGHQVQADHEQIRHHDASDDVHAAADNEAGTARLTRAGLPSRPFVGSQECVQVPLKRGCGWAQGPSRGDQK